MHVLAHLAIASGCTSKPGTGDGVAGGLTPDQGCLPGSNVIHGLASGLDSWALIAAMVGVIVGAVAWAFGHYSQNYQHSLNGRKGVLVCLLAALLIGAAPHLIEFFVGQGGAVK